MDDFNTKKLFKYIGKYSQKMGKELVYNALVLYYVLVDEKTPKSAKKTIIAALLYFLSPIDLIADLIPIIGFSDDLPVLLMAISYLSSYITEEIKEKALLKTNYFFKNLNIR